MQTNILSLALVCFLAGNSLGQEAINRNLFSPERLVDLDKFGNRQLSRVAGQKDFTIRFPGGPKNKGPNMPIYYDDKIGSENFTLEFDWKTNSPNVFSSPNLCLGELGGLRGGPFISFDCNGVRLVLSALDVKSRISNYRIKDDEGNAVYVSPKYTYFLASLNKTRGEFNRTKVVFYKQTITVFQNNILAYSISLDDQLGFLKAQRKAVNGPNEPGSPNYEGIFFGKVIEELMNANRQAALYLSFQEDKQFRDRPLNEVEFKDFSLRFEEEKIDMTQFHKSRCPRELVLQDPFLQNLFAKEPVGLPNSTKTMPLFELSQGVANIQTPSQSANGMIFFLSRQTLGFPQEAFFFKPGKGFVQDFEFPPVWLNHLYNNGSIYLYAFEEGLVWTRGDWDQYFGAYGSFKPPEYQMIRGANKKMNLVVLVENSVPPEVAGYFKEKIKAWEKK